MIQVIRIYNTSIHCNYLWDIEFFELNLDTFWKILGKDDQKSVSQQ